MTTVATQLAIVVAGLSFLTACSKQEPNRATPEQSTEINYRLAHQLFASGDYELAQTKVDELCQQAPTDLRFPLLKGEISFATNHLTDSIAAFDRVIELDPQMEPQLWQRGLALYYAGRYKEGVQQFETHQTVNSQDVENAVWHLLCAAQISGVDQGRKQLIPIKGDTRVPMSQVYEMFAGRMEPQEVMAAAELPTTMAPAGSANHNLQLYFAHLYIGLYWEMMAQPDQSLAEMKLAEKVNPLGSDNFMGRVAPVHILIREQSGSLSSPNPIKTGAKE